MFTLLVLAGLVLAIYQGMFAEDLISFVFWVVVAIASAVTLGQIYMGNINV